MQLSWGWKISMLYTGFAVMIIVLVVASSRQKFDLVSADYYQKEIEYQKVIDAGHNQAALAGTITLHDDASAVYIDLPQEFKDQVASGDVHFYSAVNKDWDYTDKIKTSNGRITVPKDKLHQTRYSVRLSYTVNDKDYYFETEVPVR